jgi:energy-converting hydrogenase A subunit M
MPVKSWTEMILDAGAWMNWWRRLLLIGVLSGGIVSSILLPQLLYLFVPLMLGVGYILTRKAWFERRVDLDIQLGALEDAVKGGHYRVAALLTENIREILFMCRVSLQELGTVENWYLFRLGPIQQAFDSCKYNMISLFLDKLSTYINFAPRVAKSFNEAIIKDDQKMITLLLKRAKKYISNNQLESEIEQAKQAELPEMVQLLETEQDRRENNSFKNKFWRFFGFGVAKKDVVPKANADLPSQRFPEDPKGESRPDSPAGEKQAPPHLQNADTLRFK